MKSANNCLVKVKAISTDENLLADLTCEHEENNTAIYEEGTALTSAESMFVDCESYSEPDDEVYIELFSSESGDEYYHDCEEHQEQYGVKDRCTPAQDHLASLLPDLDRLTSLPPDLLAEVFQHLRTSDLKAVKIVNKSHHSMRTQGCLKLPMYTLFMQQLESRFPITERLRALTPMAMSHLSDVLLKEEHALTEQRKLEDMRIVAATQLQSPTPNTLIQRTQNGASTRQMQHCPMAACVPFDVPKIAAIAYFFAMSPSFRLPALWMRGLSKLTFQDRLLFQQTFGRALTLFESPAAKLFETPVDSYFRLKAENVNLEQFKQLHMPLILAGTNIAGFSALSHAMRHAESDEIRIKMASLLHVNPRLRLRALTLLSYTALAILLVDGDIFSLQNDVYNRVETAKNFTSLLSFVFPADTKFHMPPTNQYLFNTLLLWIKTASSLMWTPIQDPHMKERKRLSFPKIRPLSDRPDGGRHYGLGWNQG